jgi:hypothetical protein
MSLMSVPGQESRLRVKRLGLVAARIRFLVEDVTDATERARVVLERAARPAAAHRAAT